MNKYFFFVTTFAIIVLASCSKKSNDTSSNAVSSTSSTWTLNGTAYTSATVSVSGNTITAISAPADTEEIAFFFRGTTLPTDTGTYKVTTAALLTAADSNTKKVIVLATNTKTNIGYTVLAGTVAVTVNGGKMTAVLAPSTAANQYATAAFDTVRVSATIVQP